MAAETIEQVPEDWERVHRQGAGALLRAEAIALGLLLRAMRQTIAEVVLDLSTLPKGTNPRFVRRRAILAVRRATTTLQLKVEQAIYEGRMAGRSAAYQQILRELRLVRIDLGRAGISEDDYPSDPPDMATDETDTAQQDRLSAHAAATAFAGSWAARTLRLVLRWADNPDGTIAGFVRSTVAASEPKLRQIAATETAQAFADEHDEGVGALADENEESTWTTKAGLRVALFKYWNAMNDRKVCAVCRRHHGEIVLVGMPFDGGDVPGDVHPNCRCVPSLVTLPLPTQGFSNDEAA